MKGYSEMVIAFCTIIVFAERQKKGKTLFPPISGGQ
jgi:hypothetical protein